MELEDPSHPIERCPVCGNIAYTEVDPEGAVVTFIEDRKCTACRSIWRPGCPRWAAYVFLFVGLAICAVTVVLLVLGSHHCAFCIVRKQVILFIGGSCAAYGVSALVGTAGRARVVRRWDLAQRTVVPKTLSPFGPTERKESRPGRRI